jgi:pimeloyl-ACP methyl ester carboxylesterase
MRTIAQRAGITTVLAVCCALGAVPSLPAQDITTAFHHGFGRSPESWTYAGEQMRQRLKLSTRYPGTPSLSTYQVQAGAVTSALGLGPIASIGQSNGGIVAREWNRSGAQHSRILTVGSPHRGVPLADNVVNESIIADAHFQLQFLLATLNTYGDLEAQSSTSSGWVYALLRQVALYGNELLTIPAHVAIAKVGDSYASIPVMQQMAPSSAYHDASTGLNSPANLSREAASITHRGAVATRWRHPYFLPCHAATGNEADPSCVDIMNYSWGLAVLLFDHYNYDYDPWDTGADYAKWVNAWRWAYIANQVRLVDVKWLFWIGAEPTIYPVFTSDGLLVAYGWEGEMNDALVPVYSQSYPGSTVQDQVICCVAHSSQQHHPDAIDAMVQQLLEMDVPIRQPNSVASVTTSPGNVALTTGGSGTLTAVARTVTGSVLSGIPFTWQSSNSGVASVSATGVVTAQGAGQATITASADGYSGSTPVTVSPPPPLTVTLSGPTSLTACQQGTWSATANNPVSGVTITWFRDDVEIATGSTFEAAFDVGTYQLRVRAIDSRNEPANASITVTASPPSEGPHFPCEG